MALPCENDAALADWSSSELQVGALRRHIAEAHDKLEARLVATMEAQQAALLQAVVGLASGPRRSPREGGALPDVSPRSIAVSGQSSPPPQVTLLPSEHTGGAERVGAAARPPMLEGDVKEDMEAEEEEDEESSIEDLPAISMKLTTANQVLSSQKDVIRSDQSSKVKSSKYLIRTWVRYMKESRELEIFLSLAITGNAVSIGLSADFSIRNPGDDIPTYFRVLDYGFLCIFALELLVRLAAEGRRFFHHKSATFQWNVFDTLLVCATILNEGSFGLNFSVIRVFRVLRLVSTLRVVRLMKGFRELRLMVSGIMNCGKTLLWSIILLALVSYIYAVFCLQLASEWLSDRDAPVTGGQGATLAQAVLDDHFPSIYHGVYTLFKIVSGGMDWGDIADPLMEVSALFWISFPLYIVIAVFCVLNVITAAFVEAAHRTTQHEDSNALDHIEQKRQWIVKIRQLFSRHDENSDGILDWEEFLTVMTDWRTQAYFADIGLTFDFQNAQAMFRLFDWDANGTVSIDEFAQGIHHLHGNARSLDMFREFQALNRKLDRLSERQKRTLTRMGSTMSFMGNRGEMPKSASPSSNAGGAIDFLNREPDVRTHGVPSA